MTNSLEPFCTFLVMPIRFSIAMVLLISVYTWKIQSISGQVLPIGQSKYLTLTFDVKVVDTEVRYDEVTRLSNQVLVILLDLRRHHNDLIRSYKIKVNMVS